LIINKSLKIVIMNNKFYKKYSEEFIIKVLDIYSILNVVSYIVFSAIKRFFDNEKLLWISFVIFAINFLILIELFYKVKRAKTTLTKNNLNKFIFNIIFNFIFALFILSYFW
jgi:hypothetical protein